MLLGRVNGLRPTQKRRLERLSHRRHPEGGGAELLCLQRLAAEARELELPLSLVVDGRGLTRLLWVGPLEQSGRLIERLPGSERRQGSDLRLITCVGRKPALEPLASEALVGLDLEPLVWLRYPDKAAAWGRWAAAAYTISQEEGRPWALHREADLAELCEAEASPAPAEAAADNARLAPQAGPERVLLLALIGEDSTTSERDIAELEGLVRSAGAVPVGLIQQKRQGAAAQAFWGDGKLREAALEARRLGATLVVTDRDLTPVQARNMERLVDLPISDRTELILDILPSELPAAPDVCRWSWPSCATGCHGSAAAARASRAMGAASAPEARGKPSWRKTGGPLPAASTACNGRSNGSESTGLACARDARA